MNKESHKRSIRLTPAQIDFISDLLSKAERTAQLEYPQGPNDSLEETLAFIEEISTALSVTQ